MFARQRSLHSRHMLSSASTCRAVQLSPDAAERLYIDFIFERARGGTAETPAQGGRTVIPTFDRSPSGFP
jgi:hypothetical protein